jgi:hypothetical protein
MARAKNKFEKSNWNLIFSDNRGGCLLGDVSIFKRQTEVLDVKIKIVGISGFIILRVFVELHQFDS